MRRVRAMAIGAVLTVAAATSAAATDAGDWPAVLQEARGQTVYFNAWGGSAPINAYLGWVGDTVKAQFGVSLVQVKLDDTSHAVATVVAEKAAGKTDGGAVDLIWINGENFAAMKSQNLLWSPGWATLLPNWRLVDVTNQPTVREDFTLPTEGLESPWGGAKLVFFYDSARLTAAELPDSTADILTFAQNHPGRFSYPQPPDFLGTTFLKQVLSEVIDDRTKLTRPVDPARFAADVAPLFAYLDRLHPLLWRQGKTFPKTGPDLQQKLADGELDISFAFNPGEASAAIVGGQLPTTVRSFSFSGGTLGNSHFVAIPFNATAKAGALVVANFLLSPAAQRRKQDPGIWGDPTVLAMERLTPSERAAFAGLDLGVATLAPAALGPVLPEPHPDWMVKIEAEWQRRYGGGQ